MSTMIPNATALVNYIKNFTGSSNDTEIKQCIFLAEMSMRNIELPALRTNPWTTIGTVGSDGYLQIPSNMNKPILFFQGGNTTSGPWIVYDRIGDRDLISQLLVQNLYLNPVNIAQVVRGNFSEIGQTYAFTPATGSGTQINMYYYTTWPLLFSYETGSDVFSTTGTVAKTGSGPWTITLTNLTDTTSLTVGDVITATSGTGSFGTGQVLVTSITDSTSIVATATGGTTPTNGTVTNVTVVNPIVENNLVLSSWPEGYIYGTLREYYLKRKMPDDAAVWGAKFTEAWNTVEDQNNKGKWSGGHTKLWSVFQPRQLRRYSTK